MGRDHNFGRKAILSASRHDFKYVGLLITSSYYFDKCIKNSTFYQILSLLVTMNNDCLGVILQKNETESWLPRLPDFQRKIAGSAKQNYCSSAVVIVRWDTFSKSEEYLENTERLIRYIKRSRSTEIRLMPKLYKCIHVYLHCIKS